MLHDRRRPCWQKGRVIARKPNVKEPPVNRRNGFDDDCEPVIVPRSDKPLVAVGAERRRRLRKHLIKVLRQLRGAEVNSPAPSIRRPEPSGFAAHVAQAACALCKGWCCRRGADDGFLDHPTIARLLSSRAGLDARGVIRLYADRVPAASYEASCIFHGQQGCTLDRSLRADVCNAYFCGGLEAYIASDTPGSSAPGPVRIIAGEGVNMRNSPALVPDRQQSAPDTSTSPIIAQALAERRRR